MSSSHQCHKGGHGRARRRTILHEEAFVTRTQQQGSRSVPPNAIHEETSTSEGRSQFVERAIAKFKEAENSGPVVLEYIRVSSFPDDGESFTDAEVAQESSFSTSYGCSNIDDDSVVDQLSSYESEGEEEVRLWRSHLQGTTLSDSLETALLPSPSTASNYGGKQSTSPYFWSDNSFDYSMSPVTAVDRTASTTTTTRSYLRSPSVKTAQKGVSPGSFSATSDQYTSSSGSGMTILSPSFSSNCSSTFSGSSSDVSNIDCHLLPKPLCAQTQLNCFPIETAKSPSKICKQQKLLAKMLKKQQPLKLLKQKKHPSKGLKQKKCSLFSSISSLSSSISSQSSSTKHSPRKALVPSTPLKSGNTVYERRPSSAMRTARGLSEQSSISSIDAGVKRLALQEKQNAHTSSGHIKHQQLLDHSPTTVCLDSLSLHTVRSSPFRCSKNTGVRARNDEDKDSGTSTNRSRRFFSVPSSSQEYSLTDISSVTGGSFRTPPTSIGKVNETTASNGSSNGFYTVSLRQSSVLPFRNVTSRLACDRVGNQIARVDVRNVSSLVSDVPSDAASSQKSATQGRRTLTISPASSTGSTRHHKQQSNATPTFRHSRDLQLRMLVNDSDEPFEANLMFNFESANETPKVELTGVSLDDKPVWRSEERQPRRQRTSQQLNKACERPI